MQLTVVYSPAPRQVHEWALELPAGATVADALRASGLEALHPGFDIDKVPAGIWGRKAALDQPLREGDRVEIYRPLRVDPKVARRERFNRQGARAAGLFARRRPGGKPGY
jgi:uncharacterized protein